LQEIEEIFARSVGFYGLCEFKCATGILKGVEKVAMATKFMQK